MMRIKKDEVSCDDIVIGTIRQSKINLSFPLLALGGETDFDCSIYYTTDIDHTEDDVCGDNELEMICIDDLNVELKAEEVYLDSITEVVEESLTKLYGEHESAKDIKKAAADILEVIKEKLAEVDIEV